jgi:hypothetical protein
MATDVSIFAGTKLVDPTYLRTCRIAQLNELRLTQNGERILLPLPREVCNFQRVVNLPIE